MITTPSHRHAAESGTVSGFQWTIPGGGAYLFIPWSEALSRGMETVREALHMLDKGLRDHQEGRAATSPALPRWISVFPEPSSAESVSGDLAGE